MVVSYSTSLLARSTLGDILGIPYATPAPSSLGLDMLNLIGPVTLFFKKSELSLLEVNDSKEV